MSASSRQEFERSQQLVPARAVAQDHPFYLVYDAAVRQDLAALKDALEVASVNVIHPEKTATVASELVANGHLGAIDFLQRHTHATLAGYYQGIGQRNLIPVSECISKILAEDLGKEMYYYARGLGMGNHYESYCLLLNDPQVVEKYDVRALIRYIGQGIGYQNDKSCFEFLNYVRMYFPSAMPEAWFMMRTLAKNRSWEEIKAFVQKVSAEYHVDLEENHDLWWQTSYGLGRFHQSYQVLTLHFVEAQLENYLSAFICGAQGRLSVANTIEMLEKIPAKVDFLTLSYSSYFGLRNFIEPWIQYLRKKDSSQALLPILKGITCGLVIGSHHSELLRFLQFCELYHSSHLQEIFREAFLDQEHNGILPLGCNIKVFYTALSNITSDYLRQAIIDDLVPQVSIFKSDILNSVSCMKKHQLTYPQLQLWKSQSLMSWLLQFNSFVTAQGERKPITADLVMHIAQFLVPGMSYQERINNLPKKFEQATRIRFFRQPSLPKIKDEKQQSKRLPCCSIM